MTWYTDQRRANDAKLARLRENQDKCTHVFKHPETDCICPSFKCSLCGVYKDNLENSYIKEMKRLHDVIDFYVDITHISELQVKRLLEIRTKTASGV